MSKCYDKRLSYFRHVPGWAVNIHHETISLADDPNHQQRKNSEIHRAQLSLLPFDKTATLQRAAQMPF